MRVRTVLGHSPSVKERSPCEPRQPEKKILSPINAKAEFSEVAGEKEVWRAFTRYPVTEGVSSAVMPEAGRWQDVQRLFGIKRGTLYNLLAEGRIKSVCLRRKGNVHGCRLIFLQSVRDYLNSLAAEQSQAAQPKK